MKSCASFALVWLGLLVPSGSADVRLNPVFSSNMVLQRGVPVRLCALTKTLVESGAKVILIKPSIFDDTADLPAPNLPRVGAALSEFGGIVEKIAAELGVPLVDFNSPMLAINRDQQEINPRFSIVGPDRVHPTDPGHFVMAYELLTAMHVPGLDGRPLSPEKISAELDAGLSKLAGSNETWKERLKSSYLAEKNSEPALRQVIESAVEQARQTAVPVSHKFQLRYVRAGSRVNAQANEE
jgi:hypothetical protein